MADVLTTTYDFTQPEVGGSDDTWGDKLNANWDKIDDLLTSTFVSGGSPSTLGTTLRLTGTTPTLQFLETDAASPAGQFAFYGAGVGSFYFARHTGASFTTPDIIWSTSSAGDLTVYKPTAINDALRIGAVDTTATTLSFQGTGASNYIDSFATANLIFRSSPGAIQNARIDAVGTTAAAAITIMTREKGDARYLSLAGATQSVSSVVTFTTNPFIESASPVLYFTETDQTDPAGRYRLMTSGNTFYLQRATLAASWSSALSLLTYDTTNGFNFSPNCLLATQGGFVEVGGSSQATIKFMRPSVNWLAVPDGMSLRVMNHSGTTWATVSSASGWAAGTSDIRMKENVAPVHYGLDTVMALRPIQFDWIADGKHDIGFSAQDMQKVIPEIVEVWEADPDIEGQIDTYAMRKDALVVVLVKAVQELVARLREQDTRIAALEGAT